MRIVSQTLKPIVLSYRRHQLKKQMQRFDHNLDACLRKNNVVPISDKLFNDVNRFWKQYLSVPVGKQYYSLLNHIDPTLKEKYPLHVFVSESIMFPNIIRKLNPMGAVQSLSNKGMYGVIFKDINRPYEYMRVCNGTCLDGNNRIIKVEEAIKSIVADNQPIVVKQSKDSYGGLGVRVLREYNEETLKSIFKNQYVNDYVVQRWIKQSDQLGRLNYTSLNTCRIITLLFNNNVSVIAHNVRVGGKGKSVDNVASGGMNVGVTADGVLTEGVQDEVFHIKQTPDGLPLKGYKIDSFKEVCEFAKTLHQRIPLCAIAGWDIGLDGNDKPILIEVNLNCPDVKNMQMINGPFFKDRFEEMIEYVF